MTAQCKAQGSNESRPKSAALASPCHPSRDVRCAAGTHLDDWQRAAHVRQVGLPLRVGLGQDGRPQHDERVLRPRSTRTHALEAPGRLQRFARLPPAARRENLLALLAGSWQALVRGDEATERASEQRREC